MLLMNFFEGELKGGERDDQTTTYFTGEGCKAASAEAIRAFLSHCLQLFQVNILSPNATDRQDKNTSQHSKWDLFTISLKIQVTLLNLNTNMKPSFTTFPVLSN